MKKVLLLLLLFSCLSTLYAQDDRFFDVNQTKGKEVYVSDNSAINVAYMIVEGKVKPVSKIKNASITMAGKVYSVENNVYTFKKKPYLILKNAEEILLLKEEDAPLFLSSFISKTYWQEKYDSYCNDYTYLDFKKYNKVHSTIASVEYDDLARIEWCGLEISKNGAIYYMHEFKGTRALENFSVTQKFFEDSKDLYFIKKENIQPYIDKYNARIAKEKREKEIADSIRVEKERREKEIADSIANSKLRLAVALKDATFTAEERTIEVSKGDTLVIYSYEPADNKFLARHRYANLLFEPEDIEFLDTKTTTTAGNYSWEKKTIKTSADADYLKKQGEIGIVQRFHAAWEYDDIQTDLYIEKLESKLEFYKKEVAYRKKNQIFITGIGYAYDNNSYSSRFGMRFDVYNCFSKTIKYVEFTMTNYNAVDDVQRDDIGRSSRTVKGIGPIEPGEGGRYSWDDIFWDDRNIIKQTRLTNVKFIFKDGSTRVFSGYANINKHMTVDAWEDD